MGEFDHMTDEELRKATEQNLTDVGVDMDGERNAVRAEQKEKFNAWAAGHEARVKASQEAAKTPLADQAIITASDVGMGIGTAFIDINRNLTNGIIGLADLADNTLKEMGVTQDDLITDRAYIKDQHLKEKAEMGDAGKVAHALYKVAAPMALGAASVPAAPVVGSLAVDAAYNFFGADPNGGRLADVVKDTWVENVPIAGSLVNTLATKPTDSEMTGRIKNMSESLMLGSGIAMLFNMGKARNAYNKMKGLFTKEGGVVPPPDVPPTAPAAPAVSEAELAASDAALSTPKPPARVEMFGKGIAKHLQSGGSVDDVYEDVARFRQALPEEEVAAFDAHIFGEGKGQQGQLKLAVDDFNKFEAEQAKEAAHMAEIMGADRPLVEVTTSKKYLTDQPPTVSRRGLILTDETVSVAQADLNNMNIQVRKNDMKSAKDGSVELSVFIDENGERYVAVAGKSAIREADFVEMRAARAKAPEVDMAAAKAAGEALPNAAGPTAVTRAADNTIRVGTPHEAVTKVVNAISSGEINLLRVKSKDLGRAADMVKANPKLLSDAIDGKLMGKDKEWIISFYISKVDEEMFDLAKHIASTPDDAAAQARLAEHFALQSKLADAMNGIQGRPLLASPTTGEFLAEVTGSTQKAALERLGRQGRAQYIKEVTDRAGGTEAIASSANSAMLLQQIEALQNVPDTAFINTTNGVRMRARARQYVYALNQTLVSSLLTVTGAVRIGVLNNFVLGMELGSRYLRGAAGLLKGSKDAWTEARLFDLGAGEGIRASLPQTWRQIKGGTVEVNGKSFSSVYDRLDFMPAMPTDTGASIFGKIMSKADIHVGTPLMKGLGAISNVIPNVYGAFDNPHKFGIYTGNMRVAGFRLGKQLKLEGDELKQFIDDFAVGRVGARHMEKPAVLNQWSKADIVASREAGVMTGSAELGEAGKAVAAMPQLLMENVPVFGSVMPFMRATVNQFVNDIRFTPVGLLKTGADLVRRADANDADAMRDISRIAVGSVMMGGIYQLVDAGLIRGDSTDWGTTNALREQKSPTGAAIKVNGEWYDLSRLGIVSNMINTMVHMRRVFNMSDETFARQSTVAMVAGYMDIVTPQILLETLGTLSDLVTGRTTDEMAGKFMAKFLGSRTPLVNWVSPLAQIGNDQVPSTQGDDFSAKFRNHLLARIPHFNKDMRPVLNYWGEEIKAPDSVGMNIDLLAGASEESFKLQDTLTDIIQFNENNAQYSSGMMSMQFPLAPKNVTNVIYNEMKATNDLLRGDVDTALTVDEQWNYQKIAAGIDPVSGKPSPPTDANGVVLEGYEGKTLKAAVTEVLKAYKAFDVKPWDMEANAYAQMLLDISMVQQAYREHALKAINSNPIIRGRMQDEAAKATSFAEGVRQSGGLRDVGQ